MSGTSFDCYSDWQCQSNQSKNVRFEMLQLQSATDPRSNPFPVPHCRSGLCSGHFQPDSTSRSTTRSSSTGRTLISSSATRSTNQSIPITIQTSFGTSLASQSSASCLSPIANLSSTTFEFEQAVRQVRSKSNPSSRSSIHNSRLNPSKPLRESHDRLENSTENRTRRNNRQFFAWLFLCILIAACVTILILIWREANVQWFIRRMIQKHSATSGPIAGIRLTNLATLNKVSVITGKPIEWKEEYDERPERVINPMSFGNLFQQKVSVTKSGR